MERLDPGNKFQRLGVTPIMETECSIWQGHPSFYQEQALISIVESGKRIWPWSWVSSECGEEMCLEPDHLNLEAPRKLEYPPYICVYCGDPADTQDHIIPTALTGVEQRKYVLTVPACRQCNSAISDRVVFSIDNRRRIAQAYIARKFKKVLSIPDYSREEIYEFEGTLRQSVIEAQNTKEWITARLKWPDSPHYDLKHLQASGIENPFVAGLLAPDEKADGVVTSQGQKASGVARLATF